MHRSLLAALLFATTTMASAAPALFPTSTESKWNVASSGSPHGSVTVLTSSKGTRAEWKPDAKSAAVVFLGNPEGVWMRTPGGDVPLDAMSSSTGEKAFLPPLLLPTLTAKGDAVDAKGGKVLTYTFRGQKASYKYDAKGPSVITVTSGSLSYTLTRTAAQAKSLQAATFEVKPKQGAASKLARLSGNLLGPSSTSVSATAGGRGVDETKWADGGDYEAVIRVDQLADSWQGSMDQMLAEFQKNGNVGRNGGH